jgi:hypothetical protein
MTTPSRLEATRRKLRLVRYGVVAASTAAFAGFALVARAGHPGTSTVSSPASQSSTSVYDESQSQEFDDFGPSSIGPSSGSTPAFQSGGS